jgi:hypothetical protein
MRSIYRGRKVIRRKDGSPLCVLEALPVGLGDDDRQKAESLREEIKTEIRGWFFGGHILIDIFEDRHAEPVGFLWELGSDPRDPLTGECWDDPINILILEVFQELHGNEYRSARDPATTSPDEDTAAWIAWALNRNAGMIR